MRTKPSSALLRFYVRQQNNLPQVAVKKKNQQIYGHLIFHKGADIVHWGNNKLLSFLFFEQMLLQNWRGKLKELSGNAALPSSTRLTTNGSWPNTRDKPQRW